MNKHILEVTRIGGEALMKNVRKEFENEFFIVSRTPDDIVLSNNIKNVKFSRKNNRVIERHTFEGTRGIKRK